MTRFEKLAINAAFEMMSEWYDKGGKSDAQLIAEYFEGKFTVKEVEKVLDEIFTEW